MEKIGILSYMKRMQLLFHEAEEALVKQPEAAKLAILYFRRAADHFVEHPGPKDDLQQNALSRIRELTRFAV